jgi:hypothetical protein
MGLLTLLLSFVFFAGVSMTVNEGLWNNTITAFIIIVAALIAIPWGYVMGGVILVFAQPSEENAWAFIFAGVWGVFALSATIMRLIADRLSRVRLRFVPQLDKIGGVLMGLVVATLFNSFLAVTLVLLPLEAGVWKVEDGSPTQQKAMSRAAAPIYTALTKFYGGEFSELTQARKN